MRQTYCAKFLPVLQSKVFGLGKFFSETVVQRIGCNLFSCAAYLQALMVIFFYIYIFCLEINYHVYSATPDVTNYVVQKRLT